MTMQQPTRDRVRIAIRHTNARADWLDKQAAQCGNDDTCRLIAAWAHDLRSFGRIILGDIGREEEQEEWDIEPLTTPAPVEVPATTPAEPVPA